MSKYIKSIKNHTSTMFCVLIFSIPPIHSFAGYRSDHLIAWINFEAGADGREIAKKISNFANSDHIDKKCKINWKNNDSILYINNRRLKVSDDLIKKVFIEKDKKSHKELSNILRSFRDREANVRDGLDGIFFYDGEKSFQMMSFTAGARKVETYPATLKASTHSEKVETAFCALLPKIVRAP